MLIHMTFAIAQYSIAFVRMRSCTSCRKDALARSFQLHEEERVLQRREPGNGAISVSDPSSQPRMRA